MLPTPPSLRMLMLRLMDRPWDAPSPLSEDQSYRHLPEWESLAFYLGMAEEEPELHEPPTWSEFCLWLHMTMLDLAGPIGWIDPLSVSSPLQLPSINDLAHLYLKTLRSVTVRISSAHGRRVFEQATLFSIAHGTMYGRPYPFHKYLRDAYHERDWLRALVTNEQGQSASAHAAIMREAADFHLFLKEQGVNSNLDYVVLERRDLQNFYRRPAGPPSTQRLWEEVVHRHCYYAGKSNPLLSHARFERARVLAVKEFRRALKLQQ